MLTPQEKQNLRKRKLYIKNLDEYDILQLQEYLETDYHRAREIFALIQFQSIPSIGIKCAEDLIFMNFYSLEELKNCNPAQVFDSFEKKKNYWVDSCVEDQFRLVIDYAKNGDKGRNWWDFTAERNEYRQKHGFPADRPKKPWYEVCG